jgi:membrane protein YdbS with pleckstrin-like domain
MEELFEQLRRVSLFSQLKTRTLRRIAELFERLDFDQADYLSRQGEIGDRFYLIVKGQALVWHVDANGAEQAIRELHAGDYYGITSLFLEEARDATVRIQKNSTVYSLERSLFSAYLDDFPSIRDDLIIPDQVRMQLDAPHFKWMTPDETTVFYATRTRWALLSKQLVPALIFLALMFIAAVVPTMFYLPTVVALLAVLIGGGWGLLRWQDWRNDYYVVTNKRVVHHESRLPTLQVTVDQAPLHQIQNVNMLKAGPIERMLNIGTLEIQTAGQRGSITFKQMDEPAECQQLIIFFFYKQRSLSRVSERVAIQDAISQRVHPTEEEPLPEEDLESPESPTSLQVFGEAVWDMGEDPPQKRKESAAETPNQLSSIGEQINAYLPHFRQEKDGIVTWHKHPFILLKTVSIPLTILITAFLVGLFGAIARWTFFNSLILVLFVVWCLGLFWFLWRYEDWRNDIFQMTGSHIVDIDRLPLGLRESRRQAALEQIQNINVDIPNIWARIFNYGNVVIETAGATGDLIFEWVMRPRAIQAEIFAHIEALRAKQRAEEAEQRRSELADWFAVYHQMKERGEV